MSISIFVVGDHISFHADDTTTQAIQISLKNHDVQVLHSRIVYSQLKDTKNKKMIVSTMLWMHDYLCEFNKGGVVLIFSSDIDCFDTIIELNMNTFFVILARTDEAHSRLRSAPNRSFKWKNFIEKNQSLISSFSLANYFHVSFFSVQNMWLLLNFLFEI